MTSLPNKPSTHPLIKDPYHRARAMIDDMVKRYESDQRPESRPVKSDLPIGLSKDDSIESSTSVCSSVYVPRYTKSKQGEISMKSNSSDSSDDSHGKGKKRKMSERFIPKRRFPPRGNTRVEAPPSVSTSYERKESTDDFVVPPIRGPVQRARVNNAITSMEEQGFVTRRRRGDVYAQIRMENRTTETPELFVKYSWHQSEVHNYYHRMIKAEREVEVLTRRFDGLFTQYQIRCNEIKDMEGKLGKINDNENVNMLAFIFKFQNVTNRIMMSGGVTAQDYEGTNFHGQQITPDEYKVVEDENIFVKRPPYDDKYYQMKIKINYLNYKEIIDIQMKRKKNKLIKLVVSQKERILKKHQLAKDYKTKNIKRGFFCNIPVTYTKAKAGKGQVMIACKSGVTIFTHKDYIKEEQVEHYQESDEDDIVRRAY